MAAVACVDDSGRDARAETAGARACGPVSSAVAPEEANVRLCFSFAARTKIGSSETVGYWCGVRADGMGQGYIRLVDEKYAVVCGRW